MVGLDRPEPGCIVNRTCNNLNVPYGFGVEKRLQCFNGQNKDRRMPAKYLLDHVCEN